MIVADRKPITEILDMVKDCNKILVLGCKGCVTVCNVGGTKEVGILSSALKIARKKEGNTGRILKTAKDMVVAGALYDTAYREFLNILMFNIGQGMFNEYHDQKVKHLFYTGSTCYNVQYYVISKLLKEQGKEKVHIQNVSLSLEEIEKAKKENATAEDNKQNNPGTAETNTGKV